MPPSVGSRTVVRIAVCPSLGAYTFLGFVRSTLPFPSRCPPRVALVPLYVTLYVHPQGRPSAVLVGRRLLQCPKYAPHPVDPWCWTLSCTSYTSILRGLSTSSVLWASSVFWRPAPYFRGFFCISGALFMSVFSLGVARLRRVAVVVAGGGPKPPLRELSPF